MRLPERLTVIIADMQHLSDKADDANGASEYQTALMALALVARHFLRELPEALAAVDPVQSTSVDPSTREKGL